MFCFIRGYLSVCFLKGLVPSGDCSGERVKKKKKKRRRKKNMPTEGDCEQKAAAEVRAAPSVLLMNFS